MLDPSDLLDTTFPQHLSQRRRAEALFLFLTVMQLCTCLFCPQTSPESTNDNLTQQTVSPLSLSCPHEPGLDRPVWLRKPKKKKPETILTSLLESKALYFFKASHISTPRFIPYNEGSLLIDPDIILDHFIRCEPCFSILRQYFWLERVDCTFSIHDGCHHDK